MDEANHIRMNDIDNRIEDIESGIFFQKNWVFEMITYNQIDATNLMGDPYCTGYYISLHE